MGTYEGFNAPGGAFEEARRKMLDRAAEEFAQREKEKGDDIK